MGTKIGGSSSSSSEVGVVADFVIFTETSHKSLLLESLMFMMWFSRSSALSYSDSPSDSIVGIPCSSSNCTIVVAFVLMLWRRFLLCPNAMSLLVNLFLCNLAVFVSTRSPFLIMFTGKKVAISAPRSTGASSLLSVSWIS